MLTPENLDTKAVPNVPFYLSQANQEFLGTPVGYASATMGAAGVPVPGYVSALAGLSSILGAETLTITVGDGINSNHCGYANSSNTVWPGNAAGALVPASFHGLSVKLLTALPYSSDGMMEMVGFNEGTIAVELPTGEPCGVYMFSTAAPGTGYGVVPVLASLFYNTIGETYPLVLKQTATVKFFIDPETYPETAEVRAYETIALRDEWAPSFTQEVPQPPQGIQISACRYVDGTWTIVAKEEPVE